MKLYRNGKLVCNAPGYYVDSIGFYLSMANLIESYDYSVFKDIMEEEFAWMDDKDISEYKAILDCASNGDIIIYTTCFRGNHFVYSDDIHLTDCDEALSFWYNVLKDVDKSALWKIELDPSPIYGGFIVDCYTDDIEILSK